MTNHPRRKIEAIRKMRSSPNKFPLGANGCTCDPELNLRERAKFKVGQVVYWTTRHAYVRVACVWWDEETTAYRYNVVDAMWEDDSVRTHRWDVARNELHPLTKKEAGR